MLYFQQIAHHVISHWHPLTTCRPNPTQKPWLTACPGANWSLTTFTTAWTRGWMGSPSLQGRLKRFVGSVRTGDWSQWIDLRENFTGKPHISRENRWFPVQIFPLNQSIDEDDGNMMEIYHGKMMEKSQNFGIWWIWDHRTGDFPGFIGPLWSDF